MSHNPLIFALDYDNGRDAVGAAAMLHGVVGTFKIGLELYVSEGPQILHEVAQFGDIFLDLKMCDIPTTVERALRPVGQLAALAGKIKFATVHAVGGFAMMAAAVKAVAPAKVLGVTVLTSMTADDLESLGHRKEFWSEQDRELVQREVLRRAKLAQKAGCGGLICAPTDLTVLRQHLQPGMLYVTPGVRPAGADQNDQSRVATPEGAIKEGADYLVVGRPIRDAADPVEAAKAILAEATKACRLPLPGVEV
jgi:orotidine-5'-phosphate decarboxylase